MDVRLVAKPTGYLAYTAVGTHLGEVRRVAVRSHIRRGHDQVAPWWRAYDPQGIRLLCPMRAGFRMPLVASMVQTRAAALEALERNLKGDRTEDPDQGDDG